jgi:acetyl esterase
MAIELSHLIDPRLLPLVEESRAFYADRGARRGPSSWEELRRARTDAPDPVESQPPPIQELVDGVPVRVHTPAHGEASGVLLEIHGGGFYLGSAAGSDVRNRQLADATGMAVVSVDHRLSPEHPWPAAPDDCEAAARWLVDITEERFGTSKVAIIGFSSGSTLAMTTMLRLRDRGVQVDAAVLQFGTYDLSGRTPAGRLIEDEYFIEAYAGTADRTDPDVSPIYADLTGLPPVLMVIGEADILLRDNLAMAERLSAAGVDVDLRVYPEAPHGFTGHPTPMGRAALDDIEAWLTARAVASAPMGAHEHNHDQSTDMFEPASWEERYSGEEKVWSGNPNAQLVAEASKLTVGTALDVGCGEGGDVIWLAQQGWQVTGADFSANGLARAAHHASEAGVADRTSWWQVDARTFEAEGRAFDLVTTHFLHPPDGGMVEVAGRLAGAVAPGGHLLVVGHAPHEVFTKLNDSHRKAMFLAEELLPALPEDFEAVVVEQRPRTMTRDGEVVDVDDSTLLARRRA